MLVETVLVLPVLVVVVAAILEIGNIFWQYQQLQTGVADAARYMARCPAPSPDFAPTCSAAIARNIAVFGVIAPTSNAIARVPGWRPQDITIGGPGADGVFTVSTSLAYRGSPLLAMTGLKILTLGVRRQARVQKW